MHGAGGVDDEDQLACNLDFRLALRRCAGIGQVIGRLVGEHWWHQGDRQVGLVVDFLGEQGGPGRGGRGVRLRRPGEHEIAVGRHAARGQREDAPAFAHGLGGHRVVEAFDLGQRHPGIEMDRQRQAVLPRAAGFAHRTEEIAARRVVLVRQQVGRAVADGLKDGLGGGCGLRRGDHRRFLAAGRIARRHHHGKTQLETAVPVKRPVLILDLDGDPLTRADVGHRGHEDVGPLAGQQAGIAALGGRLLENFFGLLPGQDAALDAAPADLHDQAVDGRALGQREDIDPLEPYVGRVDETLANFSPGDLAVDANDHVALQAGRFQQGVAAPAAEEQPGRPGLVCRRRRVHGGLRPGAARREDRQG